ncbi:uncharacterized protein V6R79_024260 [Siganus canaliculatus]
MTVHSFHIFTIFCVYLSFIQHSSHGFKVIQPQNRTITSDGVASILCEHTANVTSVEDFRLNSLALEGEPRRTLLCQKGMKPCEKVVMIQEHPESRCLFILHNIGPEDMKLKYECEVTVNINDFHRTVSGTPTILLPGEKEGVCICPPPPPSQPVPEQVRWILVGVLALVVLYSCVITSFCIRLKVNASCPENSTYVVMRKAPLLSNAPSDIYCG